MRLCPNFKSSDLLENSLTPDKERQFIEHLDQCQTCQQRLQAEAFTPEFEDETRLMLAPSSERISLTFDSLQLEMAQSSDSESSRFSAYRIDLSFLSPSDDPASLGRIGGYEILALLGRGGTGIVLKAFDSTLSRNVAIKILDPRIAEFGAARQRFAREARAMAAISHEHLLPIYAVDEHLGIPYLVMEYVAGGTLESRIQKEGSMPVLAAVRVGLQIAQALSVAHENGLIHRDIKPANILLDRGIERVRVADFGLVRISHETSQTHSGVIAGTPQFMSPEQIRGEQCDAQTDLFSLGSLLYMLCTGHSPFRAETPYAVMQKIVHSPVTSIRPQQPEIPAWFEGLILKLLSKDPADRFSSSKEVASILSVELAHLNNPLATRNPARAWLRKRWNRRSVVKMTALVLVLAAGTTASYFNPFWQNVPHNSVGINQAGYQAQANQSQLRAIEATHNQITHSPLNSLSASNPFGPTGILTENPFQIQADLIEGLNGPDWTEKMLTEFNSQELIQSQKDMALQGVKDWNNEGLDEIESMLRNLEWSNPDPGNNEFLFDSTSQSDAENLSVIDHILSSNNY